MGKYNPTVDDAGIEEQVAQSKKRRTAFENLLGQAFEGAGTTSGENELPTQEIRRYREQRQQPPTIDPLRWWRERESEFPKLAKIAQIVLAIPATSVPSERLFSSAGELLSKKRLRMKPDLADKLLFLRENSKRY